MSMLTSLAAPAVVRVLRRSSRLSARTQLLTPSVLTGRVAAVAARDGSSSGRSSGTFRLARQVRTSASAAADVSPTPSKAPASVEGAINGFANRLRISVLLSGADGGASRVGSTVTVRGWVRTVRNQKQFAFIEVNDGSCLTGIQVVVNADTPSFEQITSNAVTTGASVVVTGVLVASPGGKQSLEIKAESLAIIGGCDAEKYPLQKKRHTLEYLREIAHLRPRTNTIGAVARVRNALSYATHNFFQGNGFVYVQTPIITASDCEGAGEQFAVTTLLGNPEKPLFPPAGAASAAAAGGAAAVEELKAQVAAQGDNVRVAKAAKSEGAAAEVEKLLALKAKLAAAEEAAAAQGAAAGGGAGIPILKDGRVDFSKDFFGKAAFLTVSGQLNGEIYASALGDIYTFGPTFRAENSNTSRHLAEFWMVEPELSFADLKTDMDCAEAYLKHCITHLLSSCDGDLDFFERTTPGLRERLRAVAERPFARITYTEAVDELHKAIAGGRKFEYPVEWGRDLQSEHERFLTEEVHKGTPVIVYDYPKQCKAFYMRLNDDGKTVAAMDVLVPRVGELMGGSQREERLDVLEDRLAEVGLDKAAFWWYLDLRRYGSAPHAGFGLGFERLVQYATGVENIRDVIPFPRYPGNAEF